METQGYEDGLEGHNQQEDVPNGKARDAYEAGYQSGLLDRRLRREGEGS